MGAQEGQLCAEGWGWGAGLFGSGDGIPGSRDPGAGGECCQGQQEVTHYTQAPPACYQERRGVEQAAGLGDYITGWGASQHPHCLVAQEKPGCKGRGVMSFREQYASIAMLSTLQIQMYSLSNKMTTQ